MAKRVAGQDDLGDLESASPPMPGASAGSSFAARLDLLTGDPERQNRPLVATSVELVGLQDIPLRVGEMWPAISARAVAVVVGELQSRLSEPDFYVHYRDFSFMVCYAELDRPSAEVEARDLCASIRSRLADRIPEIAAVVEVEHFVAEIDRQTLRSAGSSAQDRLYEMISRMHDEAKAAAQRSRSALLRDFQLQFAPVWHAAKEMVVINRCLLDMASGPATLARFQALAEPTQIAVTLAEVDYTVLAKALELLHQSVLSRPMGALLVPVTFATLESEAFGDEYVRMLEAIPQSYRRLLLIELTGVEDATPAARIDESLSPLRDLVKGISVEIPLNYPDLEALLELRYWGVAVNLGGTQGVDFRFLSRIKQIASLASQQRVVSIAHRATTMGLAAAAFESGYTYLDGPAIHPLQREPKPPSSLPLVSSMMKMGRTKW